MDSLLYMYFCYQMDLFMNNFRACLLIVLLFSVYGCGGGGSDSTPSPDIAPSPPPPVIDTDNDGIADAQDDDDDGDGVLDNTDAFPLDPNEFLDTDADGIGNNADTDDDGDAVLDGVDAFPLDPNESLDTDADGLGNNADTDDDGDGIIDDKDIFPLRSSEWLDTDNDSLGNNEDDDDDNDGVLDVDDAFPLDNLESKDTDLDGVGDNSDAYPLQSACNSSDEGNGKECYVSIIAKQSSQKVVSNQTGQVYFYNEDSDDILLYDVKTQSFSTVDLVTSETEQLNSLAYSDAHNRLYLGFSSGRISYLEQGKIDTNDLVTLDDPIEEISAAGNFIIVEDDTRSWHYHTVLDKLGEQKSSRRISNNSEFNAWNSSLERFYFLYGSSSPYDLAYEVVDQQSGIAKSDGRAYNSSITAGPIIVSPDGRQLIVGNGDVYDSNTLERTDSAGINFQAAIWASTERLIAFSRYAGITQVVKLDENFNVELLQKITGELVHALEVEGKIILVVSVQGSLEFIEINESNDFDGDGVENKKDAFPRDARASVDTDNDGFPDSWNKNLPQLAQGVAGRVSESIELVLDIFPLDSACNSSEHATNGECDISKAISSVRYDELHFTDDTVYMLDGVNHIINRWSLNEQTYLNPIMLRSGELLGSPTSLARSVDGKSILVGYDTGALYRFTENGLELPNLVKVLSSKVGEIFTGEDYSLTVLEPNDNDRSFVTIDNLGNIGYEFGRGSNSNDYQFIESSKNFYYFTNTYSDSLIQLSFNDSGSSAEFSSFRYANSPSTFMSISPDESLIVNSHRTVIKNFSSEPTVFDLPVDSSISTSAKLNDFFWLSNIGVAYFSENNNHFLNIVDIQATRTLGVIALEGDIVSVEKLNNVLLLTRLNDSITTFELYDIEIDSDGDQIPFWWESVHGFSDQDETDSRLDNDEDRLTNLQEYQNRTLPSQSDTDNDGLSDGHEVLDYVLNPLNIDTDSDSLPDLWEVENGLNGADPEDANLDSDNDGISNYVEFRLNTDPQDNTSLPEMTESYSHSFEQNDLPENWSLDNTAIYSTAQASNGAVSLKFADSETIKWHDLFSGVQVDFQVKSTCYSRFDKKLNVYVDGERVYQSEISQSDWEQVSFLLPPGFHEIDAVVDSYNNACGVFVDNIIVKPLESFAEMEVNSVVHKESTLLFYNHNNELVRKVNIPQLIGYVDTKHLTILDDGRVAVTNGGNEPVLSVYTPKTHTWQHIEAPAWSQSYKTGSLDAIGNRIITANSSTYDSPTSGIVEFDLSNNSVRYVDVNEADEFILGLNDVVYGLSNTEVRLYDSTDFSLNSSIALDAVRAIAVDQYGNIYGLSSNDSIDKYDATGTLVKSLSLSSYAVDIKIRESGQIAFIDSNGRVYLTSTELEDYSLLAEHDYYSGVYFEFSPDIDTDNDNIPDWWESTFGLDREDPSDANTDLDNDGLSALEEYNAGTQENNIDSDLDGLSDGDEVNVVGSSPLKADSDKDGLNDNEEVDLGTDPLNKDSDSDGLTDFREHSDTETDPLLADTDSDGIRDDYEVLHRLDPKVDDAALDADDDGLTNLAEYTQETDPNNSDTDGDSLSDGDEVNSHNTSPLLVDTDKDQVNDNWEVTHGLDANDNSDAVLDNDNDSFTNLEEYFGNSDPNDVSNVPQPIAWQTHQGGASHTGYTPHILDTDNFSLLWQKNFDSITRFNPVVASDSKVFTTTGQGNNRELIALNSANGDIEWQLSFSGVHTIDAPAFADGLVYFQTGGHSDSFLRAVNADSGEIAFESSYGNQWSSYLAPTPFGNDVYIAGGYYGGVYSFDAKNGGQNWFYNGPQYDGFTPAVDEKYTYAFTTSLDILDSDSGEVVKSIDFPGFDWRGYDVEIAPVLTKRKNIVVTQEGSLVVFDTEEGSILWNRLNEGFSSQVSFANSVIYAITNGSLHAVDELTGDTKWMISEHDYQSNIVVTKTHIFIGDSTHTFAIDRETRQEVWSYSAAGNITITADGMLYIAGTELTAIDLK